MRRTIGARRGDVMLYREGECKVRSVGSQGFSAAVPPGQLSVGAGEGNRTLVISLEGCCSTIELHPRTFTAGALTNLRSETRSNCSPQGARCGAQRSDDLNSATLRRGETAFATLLPRLLGHSLRITARVIPPEATEGGSGQALSALGH